MLIGLVQIRESWYQYQPHVEHYWLQTLDHLRRIKVNIRMHSHYVGLTSTT